MTHCVEREEGENSSANVAAVPSDLDRGYRPAGETLLRSAGVHAAAQPHGGHPR